MPYGHDEETIIADCVWRNGERFHCVGEPQPYTLPVRALRALTTMLPGGDQT